ncbi:MAG: endolytic transglycosylase MltG, partial [bacterium]|nr:endolytic transglycosylase MltG [bacterium]
MNEDRPNAGFDPLIGEPDREIDPAARSPAAGPPPAGEPRRSRPPQESAPPVTRGAGAAPPAPPSPRDPAPGDMLLDPEAIAEDEALFFGDDAWIRFRRPWGFWRRVLVLAGGLALLLGGAYWWGNSWLQRQLDPPGEAQGRFLVEIPSGAGVNDVARILANEGVVANATITRLWWRDAGNLQAGAYYFAENMSVDEARATLESGPIPPVFESITIPEGLWLSEIADRLLDSLPEFDPVELQAALGDGQIRSRYLPAEISSLEGVLFPDTYQVDERGVSDERDLVRRMVEQFDTVAAQIGYDDAVDRIGLTPYQLLVAASIIEAEAARSGDRPKVARVIYNRLNAGMPLQMDATVLYAIGRRKSSLTLTDLDVDSPYNTRKFAGLPPTPIA